MVIVVLYNTSVKIYRSIVTFNISIMSRKNKNQTNIWIAIHSAHHLADCRRFHRRYRCRGIYRACIQRSDIPKTIGP